MADSNDTNDGIRHRIDIPLLTLFLFVFIQISSVYCHHPPHMETLSPALEMFRSWKGSTKVI